MRIKVLGLVKLFSSMHAIYYTHIDPEMCRAYFLKYLVDVSIYLALLSPRIEFGGNMCNGKTQGPRCACRPT